MASTSGKSFVAKGQTHEAVALDFDLSELFGDTQKPAEGETVSEIAERTGMSMATVRARLRGALRAGVVEVGVGVRKRDLDGVRCRKPVYRVKQ